MYRDKTIQTHQSGYTVLAAGDVYRVKLPPDARRAVFAIVFYETPAYFNEQSLIVYPALAFRPGFPGKITAR